VSHRHTGRGAPPHPAALKRIYVLEKPATSDGHEHATLESELMK